MSDPEDADLPSSPMLHAYTSMFRLRGDAWASLADLTKRYALTPEDQRLALRDEVSALVRLLDPLETCWAYPGRTHLDRVASLCDVGDYESAMQMADPVSCGTAPEDTPPGPETTPCPDPVLTRPYSVRTRRGPGTRIRTRAGGQVSAVVATFSIWRARSSWPSCSK